MSTKYLAENESIVSNQLDDKFYVLTKSNGLDYKISQTEVFKNIEKGILYNQFKRDVGEKLKIILHNNARDSLSIKDDMFEYILCNGQAGTKTQYPEYCAKHNITTEDFTFPDLKDGTLANNIVGSGVTNGTFVLDSIASHAHGINNITGEFRVGTDGGGGLDDWVCSGAFMKGSDIGGGHSDGGDHSSTSRRVSYKFSSHNAGVTSTNSFGDTKTQMRHTLGQIYILAKFIG